MATQNLFQVKRTSVSGRAANTTTLVNPGELALNMTDQIMYSTNGTVVFEIGANVTNQVVSSLTTTGNLNVTHTANAANVNLTGKLHVDGIANIVGNVVMSANLTVSGQANLVGNVSVGSDLTLANPGVGEAATVRFLKQNDSARIQVTEYIADSTNYAFVMTDNPESAVDSFQWIMESWQGDGGDWVPMKFAAWRAQIAAANVNMYGDVVLNGPVYIGGNNTLAGQGHLGGGNINQVTHRSRTANNTGTLTLTANVQGYTNATSRTLYTLVIDSAGTPDTFKWGHVDSTNTTSWVAENVAITGSAQELDNGVTVTFSATTGGVLGDAFQFTVIPGGRMQLAHLVANGGIWANGLSLRGSANVNYINLVSNATHLGAASNSELTSTWAVKNYIDTKVAAGSGIVVNATGVHVLANNGIVSNSTGVFVSGGSGVAVNSTGVHVLANNGIVANSTGVFVRANTGLFINSSGLFVNASSISLGTVPAARLGSGTANSTTFLAGDQTYKAIYANPTFSGNLSSSSYYLEDESIFTIGEAASGGLRANMLGAWSDICAFRDVISAEYHDGVDWVDWASKTDALEVFFDGRPDTIISIPAENKHFRFVTQLQAFHNGALWNFYQEFVTGGPFPYDYTIERCATSDFASGVTVVASGTVDSSTSEYFFTKRGLTHSAETYYRFTLNVDSADSASSWRWIKGFTTRLSYGWFQGLPVTWDKDRKVTFHNVFSNTLSSNGFSLRGSQWLSTTNTVANATHLGDASNSELTTTWAVKTYVDTKVTAGAGIVANTTGIHVLANSGLIANSTGVFVNASAIAEGTVPTARLGSGTANSTTFLAGDGSWKEVEGGGGSVTAGNGIYVDAGAVSINTGGNSTTQAIYANSTGLWLNTHPNMFLFNAGMLYISRGDGIGSSSEGIYVDVNSGGWTTNPDNSGPGLFLDGDGLTVMANTGLVANLTGLHVKANNGINVDSSGVKVTAANGITVGEGGVAVLANTGLLANATGLHLASNQSFNNVSVTAVVVAKTYRGNVNVLSDGATITANVANANYFEVTLGGNRTLGNPTSMPSALGQQGSFVVIQDGTGSRTLSYGTVWKFAGGTAPVLSTAPGAVDRLDYYIANSTVIHGVLTKAIA